MRCRVLKFALPGLCALLLVASCYKQPQKSDSSGPRMWDDEALTSLELPLADGSIKVQHASAADYYRIPQRRIWKSYPIYAPGYEPPGYLADLEQREPEVAFDASQFKSDEDWVKAGELVFDAGITYDNLSLVSEVRDPAWYEKNSVPITKDGVMPFYRYVIREKGQVEVGAFSCGMCHTRVMPDGAMIKGAQGNFPFDRVFAYGFRTRLDLSLLRLVTRQLFAVPWLEADPHAGMQEMSIEQFAALYDAVPPGVISRFGSSILYPPKVPDLIGVKDRRYLDHTGLVRQRSIEDLMRYLALVQGADILDRFGQFTPIGDLPDVSTLVRYSDDQLRAVSLYLYSLQPPPNPNKFDDAAVRGQEVFRREGCNLCHTPPLYTNNGLTPVEGFKVPEEAGKNPDVMSIVVGTDPNLTLRTRRGTGYYKVPTLKGLWYRGPFEHNGSIATLEDWFNPQRLSDRYRPTGFRGAGVEQRAIKGHRYGLKLSMKERRDLIAFLKTL
jgi:hypothetical protein